MLDTGEHHKILTFVRVASKGRVVWMHRMQNNNKNGCTTKYCVCKHKLPLYSERLESCIIVLINLLLCSIDEAVTNFLRLTLEMAKRLTLISLTPSSSLHFQGFLNAVFERLKQFLECCEYFLPPWFSVFVCRFSFHYQVHLLKPFFKIKSLMWHI